MRLRCDKGTIHQLWEGRVRCLYERRSWVRMTDRIRIAARTQQHEAQSPAAQSLAVPSWANVDVGSGSNSNLKASANHGRLTPGSPHTGRPCALQLRSRSGH